VATPTAHGGCSVEGGSALVAVEDTSQPQIDMKMDIAVFLSSYARLASSPSSLQFSR
jgi:hypothetical protein